MKDTEKKQAIRRQAAIDKAIEAVQAGLDIPEDILKRLEDAGVNIEQINKRYTELAIDTKKASTFIGVAGTPERGVSTDNTKKSNKP